MLILSSIMDRATEKINVYQSRGSSTICTDDGSAILYRLQKKLAEARGLAYLQLAEKLTKSPSSTKRSDGTYKFSQNIFK